MFLKASVLISLLSVGCMSPRTTDSQAKAQLPPDFCSDGIQKNEWVFVDSSDGMECRIPAAHCLTKDLGKCPSLSPPPPGWCKDGIEVEGEAIYVPSADGKECQVPNRVCVTKNSGACPALAQRPLDWCKDGNPEKGPPIFVPSVDGMECTLPSVRCLTKNQMACPQF
jgi:hypothetical protein